MAIVILLLAAIAAAVSMAAKPAELPMVIDDASPGVWPTYAAFGGEWCDVRPEPPAKPRGRYEYVPGAKRQGDIA